MNGSQGQRFRFLHAADLHLGSPFVGLSSLPPQLFQRVLRSAYRAFDDMIELAIRGRADAVLISGDVYDLANRPLRAEIWLQKGMEKLSAHGIPAFIAHGNHDPMDGKTAALSWPSSVHFFSSAEVECVPLRTKDRGHVADLYGISYPTGAAAENLVLRFPTGSGSAAPYRIGVLHTNVDGDASHGAYAPCSLRDLLGRGIDYWALGHIHARRVLAEHPWVVYPGNLQSRHVRETEAKGCYMVDVSPHGEASLTFHALDSIRWLKLECSVEGAETEQEIKDALEQALQSAKEQGEGRPVFVRLLLRGRTKLHRLLQSEVLTELVAQLRELEAIKAESDGGAEFVWIESVQAETAELLDRDELLRLDGFRGDLLRAVDGLLADEEAFAVFAEECLAPLWQHSKGRSYLRDIDKKELAAWLRSAEELALYCLGNGEDEAP